MNDTVATPDGKTSAPVEMIHHRPVSRRAVMGGVGAMSVLGAIGVIAGLDGSTANAATSDLEETPYGELGPYFVDGQAERSDVRTDTSSGTAQAGVTLTLNLTLYTKSTSTDAGTVLSGGRIDIWSANAQGVYSDENSENTLGVTYLRGYQISGTDGSVTFTTIFPGWYSGRTPHVHLMMRTYDSSGNVTETFTTQLFFDNTIEDTVFATSAYKRSSARDTSNTGEESGTTADRVYGDEVSEGGSAALIALTGNTTNGYVGTANLLLDLTTENEEGGTGSTATPSPGGSPPSGMAMPSASTSATVTASPSATATATASASAVATATVTPNATATATAAPDKTVSARVSSVTVAKLSDGRHRVTVGVRAGEKVKADLRVYHNGSQIDRTTGTLATGVRSISLTLGRKTPAKITALLLLTDSAGNTVRTTKNLTLK